ncbi:MAG: cupin domain-containing protein [Anaerolineales bacterium]|jgi:quercetin dioxygenase-like cupin family protein|nr:cupin domain-containing protein [Anaerolineales bacterium]
MYYYDPAVRAVKDLLPGIRTRTFWGDQMLLGVVDLDANAVLPAHSHPHEQITFVLEGELHVDIAGEQRTLRPGELMVIPGGVEHSLVVGSQPARVIDVFSPTREDLKY